MKMHTLYGIIVLFCLTPACSHAQGPEKQVLYMEDFNKGTTGEMWDLWQGWRIQQVGGNYVLSGASDAEGYFAIYTKGYWHDFPGGWTDFHMRFRIQLVEPESVVHVNFRMSKRGRYYVGFRAQGIYLHKDDGQNVNEPLYVNHDLSHSPSGWHLVDVVVEGPRIQVFVDGVEDVDVSDPDFLPGGTIAFETLPPHTVAYVDDIVLIGRPRALTVPPAEDGPVVVEVFYDGQMLRHQFAKGLAHGSEITTREGVTALIRFGGGSVAVLKPKTGIIIDSPGIITRVGEILLRIKGAFTAKAEKLIVKTVSTIFAMKVSDDGLATVTVGEGTIEVTSPRSLWEPFRVRDFQEVRIARDGGRGQVEQVAPERYKAILESINSLYAKPGVKGAVVVPMLIGLQEKEALVALRRAGLQGGKVTPIAEGDSPIGAVVRQRPEWAESVKRGSSVDLWVKAKQ